MTIGVNLNIRTSAAVGIGTGKASCSGYLNGNMFRILRPAIRPQGGKRHDPVLVQQSQDLLSDFFAHIRSPWLPQYQNSDGTVMPAAAASCHGPVQRRERQSMHC